MEKIKEQINQIWKALTYPSGLDKEYDQRCDDEFLKFLDRAVTFCWFLYALVASISIYLLITREIL